MSLFLFPGLEMKENLKVGCGMGLHGVSGWQEVGYGNGMMRELLFVKDMGCNMQTPVFYMLTKFRKTETSQYT